MCLWAAGEPGSWLRARPRLTPNAPVHEAQPWGYTPSGGPPSAGVPHGAFHVWNVAGAGAPTGAKTHGLIN